MGLALFQERRIAERLKLTGLLPGRLLLSETEVEIICRPVDVSENGIGIVLARQLEPGTLITLIMPDRSVNMRVSWVKPDFSKHDMFRYGLMTVESNIDLIQVFMEAGCLR